MASNIVLQQPGTCTVCTAMEQEIARLRTELQEAHSDPIWGIGTRQAMERRLTTLTGTHAAIVLDIDDMHGANARLGHAGVDERVAKIMRSIRQADTYAGRWLRGDEIVLFCDAANADELAARLLTLFALHGLGATITVAAAAREAIAEGIARIDEAKGQGQRGQVLA